MSEFEIKKNQDQNSAFDDLDTLKTKRKGRLISYLPALFIALITIAILVLIILGAIFGGRSGTNSETRLLHELDMTAPTAAFNDNYSYIPYDSENGELVPEQGFRWQTLESKIKVIVPDYEYSISLEINYGGFNAKPLASFDDEEPNYAVYGYNVDNLLLFSRTFAIETTNSNIAIHEEKENIAFITVIFNRPITVIDSQQTNGFLNVKKMSLSEIKS